MLICECYGHIWVYLHRVSKHFNFVFLQIFSHYWIFSFNVLVRFIEMTILQLWNRMDVSVFFLGEMQFRYSNTSNLPWFLAKIWTPLLHALSLHAQKILSNVHILLILPFSYLDISLPTFFSQPQMLSLSVFGTCAVVFYFFFS